MAKWMQRFFSYLDRYYVSHNNIPGLHEISTKVFDDEIFQNFKQQISVAFRHLYEQDRNGLEVDRSVLRSIASMFIELGNQSKNKLDDYNTCIQNGLVEDTKVYYEKISAGWIMEDSCSEYFLKTENLLTQEFQRINQCSLMNSEELIIQNLLDQMVYQYQSTILEKQTGMIYLLKCGKTDDLARIYRLCSKVPKGLVVLIQYLRNHLRSEGEKVLEYRRNKIQQERQEKNKDPVYIQKLSNLINQFKQLNEISFSNDTQFQRAIKQGMEDIMNESIGKYSAAEILATYCDSVLKKSASNMRDEEVEDLLSKAIELFETINDKDLFIDLYRNQLARRLLDEKSANEDSERSMIAKIKMCCGSQFTSRVEGMITDLKLAQEIQRKYEGFSKDLSLEFNVQVLTAANWPNYKNINVTIPTEMEQGMRSFESFYSIETQHRKLIWVFSLGSVLLQGTFQNQRTYTFASSTYQACVLLLFNSHTSMTYAEIKAIMNFDDDIAKKVLRPMIYSKTKILQKIPEGKLINENDIIQIREDFTSQMKRIKIPQASMEDAPLKEKVAEDRNLAIEAAIVRIMKGRRQLEHRLLIQDVLQMLSAFRPQISAIKQRIENLISRDFLERDPQNPQIYLYLA